MALIRAQNVNHLALTIQKLVDKSSPLLTKSTTENECLTFDFECYLTNRFGINKLFYKVKLIKVHISSIQSGVPHTINNSQGQPEEPISFTYESITQEHCTA